MKYYFIWEFLRTCNYYYSAYQEITMYKDKESLLDYNKSELYFTYYQYEVKVKMISNKYKTIEINTCILE